LEAVRDGQTQGLLFLALVRSVWFGRYLVSLPYLNYGGVIAENDEVMRCLMDQAVVLAKQLKVRHLELRHEQALVHPAFPFTRRDKVNMRLRLPASAGELWDQLPAKVRNQVRKGQKNGLTMAWGGLPLLGQFYDVFSRNMRDLGSPVYPRYFFQCILEEFPERAELCVILSGNQPVAGALLLHGCGITEVPSASSLREFNATCANMLMYWCLLERAVGRNQTIFDFGRSTRDSNTYRFKKQWNAEPFSTEWQYFSNGDAIAQLTPQNPRYQRLIRLWQRLPVRLTRWLGPSIARGIP
jgi:FemAB-related protein (PEP-CTERM system-associated)